MGLKFSDLRDPVVKWANALYLANREEFETTTVCDGNGVVKYVHGSPPKEPEYEDGEEIAPGVIFRKEGALGPRRDVPAWLIAARRRKAEADERAITRSYPV